MDAFWVECLTQGESIGGTGGRPERRAGDPVRFGWGESTRETVEVLDRWPGEDHCYYRLRADDGATYILRRDLPAGTWRLIFFRADRAANPGDPHG